MIEVEDLTLEECKSLLAEVQFGHLGCSRRNEPYVVPIHYAYVEPEIYIYTTEGKKFEIIRGNPQVCLQVESIRDNRNWKSVIVNGEAEQGTPPDERINALKLILKTNPTLTPAVSVRWMDSWVRENIEVIYRIMPTSITGRASVPGSETRPAFVPGRKEDATLR